MICIIHAFTSSSQPIIIYPVNENRQGGFFGFYSRDSLFSNNANEYYVKGTQFKSKSEILEGKLKLARPLPLFPKDLSLLVVGVKGSSTDSKSLFVRREVVLSALMWLIDSNPLYSDVTVNHNSVESLPLASVPDDFKEVETNCRTDSFDK